MKMKAMVSAALVGSLAMTAAACGSQETDPKPSAGGSSPSPASSAAATPAASDKGSAAAFPIVKDPLSVTFFTGKAAVAGADWSKIMLWQEYEKMTNIKVNFQLNPTETLTDKRSLTLASGDYPDAFYQAQVSNNELVTYGSQGVFLKLNDLIDKFAPNLKKLMNDNPSIKKAITMTDGNIYSFPWIFDPNFTSLNMGPRLWVNNEWLKKLNLKEPTTLDEFYQYLKAVKEKDPNGNGKADEIPISASGSSPNAGLGQVLARLKGAYGLMNRGNSHPLVDVDPTTNKLRFIPSDPKYKELLQYTAKLYAEGLIDKDIFTQKIADFYGKAPNNVYGSVITSNPRITMNLQNFVGVPAFKGPSGDQLYSMVNPSVPIVGGFVITNKAKNAEALVKWIDYFYSEAGSRMLMLGFKDVTYKDLPDGKFQLLDEITKNPGGLTQDQALSKYVTYPGGAAPTVVFEKNYAGGEGQPDSLEAAAKVKPNLIKEVWPTFNFTKEENEKMNTLRTDIANYIGEYEAKFVSGSAPFTEWDKFVDGFKKLKVDEYMNIYNAAYERYKK